MLLARLQLLRTLASREAPAAITLRRCPQCLRAALASLTAEAALLRHPLSVAGDRPLRSAQTLASMAEHSPGAGHRRDPDVAVALVGSREVATIALEECDRRAAGLVPQNRTVGLARIEQAPAPPPVEEQGAGWVAHGACRPATRPVAQIGDEQVRASPSRGDLRSVLGRFLSQGRRDPGSVCPRSAPRGMFARSEALPPSRRRTAAAVCGPIGRVGLRAGCCCGVAFRGAAKTARRVAGRLVLRFRVARVRLGRAGGSERSAPVGAGLDLGGLPAAAV